MSDVPERILRDRVSKVVAVKSTLLLTSAYYAYHMIFSALEYMYIDFSALISALLLHSVTYF